MKLLLLLPILVYLWLMLVNVELMWQMQTINMFWAWEIQVPFLLISSFFIAVYAILVYFIYSGINSFQAIKIHRLEKEVVELKSQLYDGQKDLIKGMKEEFFTQFTGFKKEIDVKFHTMVDFNQYAIEKILEETSGNFAKYKKESQKLLSQAKGIDKNLLEKLKIWK